MNSFRWMFPSALNPQPVYGYPQQPQQQMQHVQQQSHAPQPVGVSPLGRPTSAGYPVQYGAHPPQGGVPIPIQVVGSPPPPGQQSSGFPPTSPTQTPHNPAHPPMPQPCRAGCGFFGNPACDGYCSQCLKIAKSGATELSKQSPTCRGQCGFFGGSDDAALGFCSKCFNVIHAEPFLFAIAGSYFDLAIPVVEYLSGGGSTQRRVNEREVAIVQRLHIVVRTGLRLVDIAHQRNSLGVLGILLSAEDGEREAAQLVRNSLSTVMRMHQLRKQGGDQVVPQPAPGHGFLSHVESPLTPLSPSHQQVEDILVSARSAILNSRRVNPSGLFDFWTGHPLGVSVPKSTSNRKRAQALEEFRVTVIGQSLALPPWLLKLTPTAREQKLSGFMEQKAMEDDIKKAICFVSRVPGCAELVPFYTAADLNCLFHGVFTAMCGVRDGHLISDSEASSSDSAPSASPVGTLLPEAELKKYRRTVARDALYRSICQSDTLKEILAPPTAKDKRVDPDIHYSKARVEELLRDCRLGKASLDGGHVFALANILRRPIVVYAHEGLEGSFRANLRVPFRISGIYLPCMWEPMEATTGFQSARHETDTAIIRARTPIADPLMLCYSRGHFTALVGYQSEQVYEFGDQFFRTTAVPLCDENLNPLPIHFAAASPVYDQGRAVDDQTSVTQHTEAELRLLKKYLRGVSVVSVPAGQDGKDRRSVTLCQQWHLPSLPMEAAEGAVFEYVPAPKEPPVTESAWWKYVSAFWELLQEPSAQK